jgi:hypothetical protein
MSGAGETEFFGAETNSPVSKTSGMVVLAAFAASAAGVVVAGQLTMNQMMAANAT